VDDYDWISEVPTGVAVCATTMYNSTGIFSRSRPMVRSFGDGSPLAESNVRTSRSEGRKSTDRRFDATHDTPRWTKSALRRILYGNLLPFWTEDRAVQPDTKAGGPAPGPRLPSSRFLVFIGRCSWFFSALPGSRWREDPHARMARGAYELLRTRLHDREHGALETIDDLEIQGAAWR
jgi:hypothetical protein